MPSLTPDQRSQILSWIRSDQFDRWERGERVSVEHYLAQHPDLASDRVALLDLVYGEVLLRIDLGDLPTLGEYLGRFPSLANSLPGRWQFFQLAHPELAQQTTTDGARTPVMHRTSVTPSRLVIPGFSILEKLGEGGMGIVFKARQLDLDRVVALKLIAAGPLAGEQLLARFLIEEKAVARLDHAGVVRIHSTGQHEGWVYFCMEFIAGGSLLCRLSKGPLAIREAGDVVRQLALAVHHAHQSGVLHRDLKPGNVLLSANGEPKVSDFGLAKLLDCDDGLTQSGMPLGTPSYMAPEQATGKISDIDARTDIYALGTILYECLTGQPPFRATTRTETFDLVKNHSPLPPSRLRAEVPADLERICLKCLEKKREERYSTAEELADDLQRWLDGKRVATRSPWRFLIAGAILLTALVAVSAFFTFRSNQPTVSDETLVLIGENGKPLWHHWWKGESNARIFLEPDGTCAVHGWQPSGAAAKQEPVPMLELLPNTGKHTHYRIEADIRHLKGADLGRVGVYFAGTNHRTAKVPVSSYLLVSYNDLRDEVTRFKLLQPHIKSPPPKGNRVFFDSRYFALGDEKKQVLPIVGIKPELFRAAGHSGQAGDWRTIHIEVSPQRIRVTWNNLAVGDPTPAKVEESNQNDLRDALKRKPNHPALAGLVPRHDLRGSIGLYLFDSYASFRNVRFVPLTPDRSK